MKEKDTGPKTKKELIKETTTQRQDFVFFSLPLSGIAIYQIL